MSVLNLPWQFWVALCAGVFVGSLIGRIISDWMVGIWNKPRPLFRCSGCHKDIYPPVIKSMHYRDNSYCAECEAKYWQEAEALRARMK